MNHALKFAANVARIGKLLKSACPRLSVVVAVATLLEIVSGLGSLYLLKLLVDEVTILIGPQATKDAETAFVLLTATAGAMAFSLLVQKISVLLRTRQGLAVGEHVDMLVHSQAVRLDLQFYESSKYFDQLERARQGGAQRPANVANNAMLAVKAAALLVIVLVLVGSIEWLLVPILLAPVGVGLVVRLQHTRRLFSWRMNRSQQERRSGYLDSLLTSAVHAKEIRLNRLGPYFIAKYRDLRSDLRNGQIALENSRLIGELLTSLFGALVFVGASAWLLVQGIDGTRPISDVVLFVLLVRRAEAGGAELVASTSKIVDDHLYLGNLFDFLSIRPGIVALPSQDSSSPKSIPPKFVRGIALSGVSFKYEGASEFALRGIDLEIRPGQIVAVVGENGSGKTTLIKVLTRLYDASAGTVSLEGIDVRRFDPDEYRRLFGVIFQDFVAYAETAAENIRYGRIDLAGDAAAIRRSVESAARQAGAASIIEKLPRGYDTPLTKLFDNGQDLSVGQWQRVALARAFFSPTPFVILDEPTSAVDPKAEFELFENFRERLAGRAAVVISHRLSTIRQADYTYVLEDGRVREHGTHDALIASAGKYAELFDRQGRNYR